MVTLRRSTRRGARVSTPVTMATNPARRTAQRSIPTSSVPDSSIPVDPAPIYTSLVPMTFPTIPTVTSIPMTNLQVPGLSSTESFNFDGIQYSPYYLTNGDNPGASIISETLDCTNYNTWNLAITIALDAKNKLSFVDGSLPRPPETHPHYRIWSRCNSMVKSWLLNSVTKQIYGSILRFNDASEIWKDLMTRFRITNLPRSYHLTQQIWYLQQGSMDLSAYYTQLKILWDELDGADYVKTCQNCDCCKATHTKMEHTKIIKFLAGLNESYSNARSQIIMKKHIPDLAEVYNLLDQDYSQRSIMPVTNASAYNVADVPATSQASINAMHQASHHNQRQARPLCSHCGYSGHTVDKCCKVHGYPPGFKSKRTEEQISEAKPLVANMSVNENHTNDLNSTGFMNSLTKDQIQGVIEYFNAQMQISNPVPDIPSTSGGTIEP